MIKKGMYCIIVPTILFLIVLPGSVPARSASEHTLLTIPFDQVENQAKGSRVRFYMYGGWAHVNAWVDTYVAQQMKTRYDIDLKRVPMDAGVFINKLLNEKAAGKKKGTIDLLWISRPSAPCANICGPQKCDP